MHIWSVPIGGAPCEITASAGPNGKVFVRAFGRLVTPPIAPAEVEREFDINGHWFRLTREGNDFRLEDLGYVEPFPEPAVERAGLADHSFRRIIAIVIAAAVGLFAFVCAQVFVEFQGPLWLTGAGAWVLAAFVLIRASRWVGIAGWTLMVVLAIATLRADIRVHASTPELGSMHAMAIVTLLAAALVTGVAQWSAQDEVSA